MPSDDTQAGPMTRKRFLRHPRQVAQARAFVAGALDGGSQLRRRLGCGAASTMSARPAAADCSWCRPWRAAGGPGEPNRAGHLVRAGPLGGLAERRSSAAVLRLYIAVSSTLPTLHDEESLWEQEVLWWSL